MMRVSMVAFSLWILGAAGCASATNQPSTSTDQSAGPEWQDAPSPPIPQEVLPPLARNDTGGARRALGSARSRGLSDDHFHVLSARLDLSLGHYRQAEEHLRQAAALAPELAIVDVLRGRLLEVRGRWSDARDAFMDALRKGHPRNESVLAAVRTAIAAGDASFAVRLLQSELASDGHDAELLRALGMARLAAGNPELALAPLREAHASQPLRRDTLLQLAGALAAAGRHAELAEELAHVGLGELPVHLLRSLGRARLRQGDAEAALAPLQRAFTDAPTDLAVAVDLLRAYLLAGNLRAALEVARRAQELAPDSPRLRVLIGQAYCLAGDYARARGSFARARILGADPVEVQRFVDSLPPSRSLSGPLAGSVSSSLAGSASSSLADSASSSLAGSASSSLAGSASSSLAGSAVESLEAER